MWLWKKYRKSSGVWETKLRLEKLKKGEYEQRTFHPVKEARDFWKLFCGQEGSGDPSAPWLGVLKEAIKENVSEPREDGITFEYTSARKVTTKNKNWSAPGPDKIANFGGKRMYLTRGRVQEFLSNRKQTSRHSLVVYGRYNIIDSEARSIFPRKSVPDHLLKYHLQVVYFVPVTTNESSPWKAWLDGARATWHEREMQWNFWQPPYWSNGVSRQSELEAESQYGLGRC